MKKTNDNKFENLINWYPGHMAKAFKEINEISSICDLFIVVLDARCPISSYNEDFDKIAPNKPRLFIVTKSDLMDVSKKSLINSRFKNEALIWLDLRKPNSRNIIIKKIKQITEEKEKKDFSKGMILSKIRCFVVGIPNSGKSSLINLMAKKQKLKVANYPGVTRSKQWVVVDNLYFLDTPGILLPKFTDQEAAIKLAIIGSIKIDIFPLEFLATKSFEVISKYYPEKITNTFDVEKAFEENHIYDSFYTIGIKRGFLNVKKTVDFQKTYTYFLNWLKNLKGITLD